ncbi:unnamed protein product [Rotaria magnacalcarata]|uniref:SOCS box domain-containing protein n=1 Tax=Rotaria magnacalcarata TaxID=392030 RepID=A0A8S2R489_9BILA|nr:unnamed protein product [Rotaria magnacalcarata]
MGLHNSKSNRQLKSSTSDNNTWRSSSTSANKSLTINKRTIYYGWEEIHRCLHADWLHGISQVFGFAHHIFACNSELHSVCAPGFCSESLSRKLHGFTRCSTKRFRCTSRSILPSSSASTKSKKLREHFEYNYIPAMISSLQNYSVHRIVNGCSTSGFDHGETVMLSIYSVVLDKTKFIIVDLKLNRYVCALGDDYNGLVDASKVHSAWSMDRTQVILRVPMLGRSAALDFYKIIKKEAKLYRRIFPIDTHARFQFSPNHWSSRLALYTCITQHQSTLISYNIAALTPGGSNKTQTQTIRLNEQYIGSYLTLKNVHTWSTYTYENISFDEGFRLLSIIYTPDSVYMILTFADTRCHCGQTLPISYFDMYNANTLQRLTRVHNQLMSHTCPLHMCRNFLTPVFSVCSSRMAFCTTKNNGGRELQISIIVLPNELNLKSICRRLLLRYLYQSNGKFEDIQKSSENN